jgi:hypothetical protein
MRGTMIPVNELLDFGSGEPWRKLADETRSLAYGMKDEISKQMMLQNRGRLRAPRKAR